MVQHMDKLQQSRIECQNEKNKRQTFDWEKMNNWDYLGDFNVISSHIVYDRCLQSKTY
jgi:hypothetical protein